MDQAARDLRFVKSGPDFERESGPNPPPRRVKLGPGGQWRVSALDTDALARKAVSSWR